MAKRFIGTDIWGQDWFLDMPNDYKLFWNYIICECDHAGLYKVNAKTFGRMIESKVNPDTALTFFNHEKVRVRVITPSLWFIEDFITFQYGVQLNSANRVHNSILKLLGQVGVKLGSIRGQVGVTEGATRVRVKDKDKDKDIIDSSSNTLYVREDGFVEPSKEEVINFFTENYYSENAAISAWEYYHNLNWYDKEGSPVKNWKLKCRTVWFKDKDKIEKPTDDEIQKQKHADKIKKLYFKNGVFSYKGITVSDFDAFRQELYLQGTDLYFDTK